MGSKDRDDELRREGGHLYRGVAESAIGTTSTSEELCRDYVLAVDQDRMLVRPESLQWSCDHHAKHVQICPSKLLDRVPDFLSRQNPPLLPWELGIG